MPAGCVSGTAITAPRPAQRHGRHSYMAICFISDSRMGGFTAELYGFLKASPIAIFRHACYSLGWDWFFCVSSHSYSLRRRIYEATCKT